MGKDIAIKLDCIDGIPIVTVGGECDAFSATFTHGAMTALINEGYKSIIIDIEKLVFLDVAGFHALEDCCRMASELDGQILLVHPEKHVKEVYDMLREQGGCKMVDTLQDAYKLMGISNNMVI
ncbi:MAG TPA: STAS domain-containing protein [Candidatus Aquicultor sp.]|jgi:anti-anti-sigma factor